MDILRDNVAPKKLAIAPGIPNDSISLHRIPSLKRSIFQILPNQWMIPTKSRVSGKGNKMSMAGTITVDVPNPARVPRPLARMVITRI